MREQFQRISGDLHQYWCILRPLRQHFGAGFRGNYPVRHLILRGLASSTLEDTLPGYSCEFFSFIYFSAWSARAPIAGARP
jgi:hypothetical protein